MNSIKKNVVNATFLRYLCSKWIWYTFIKYLRINFLISSNSSRPPSSHTSYTHPNKFISSIKSRYCQTHRIRDSFRVGLLSKLEKVGHRIALETNFSHKKGYDLGTGSRMKYSKNIMLPWRDQDCFLHFFILSLQMAHKLIFMRIYKKRNKLCMKTV